MEPKYEWLRVRNRWSGELVSRSNGESWSEIEALPVGWYIAFGEQMIDELNDILVKYNFADKYRITQIKEKYGTLRWYDNGFVREGFDEYMAWQRKYVNLSGLTCIKCGEPGGIREGYWVQPLCDEHSNGRPIVVYDDDEDDEAEIE